MVNYAKVGGRLVKETKDVKEKKNDEGKVDKTTPPVDASCSGFRAGANITPRHQLTHNAGG